MVILEVLELEGGYFDVQDFCWNGLLVFGFYVCYVQNIYFKNIYIMLKKVEECFLFCVGKDVENFWVDSKEMVDVKYIFRNFIFGGDYLDFIIIRSGEDYYMIYFVFNYFFGLIIFYLCDFVNW